MLELKNILYFYPSQKDKIIIDHLTYRFEPKTVYAILGASGSGKTTLLSLMAGLDVPVQGEVCVDGKSIRTKELNSYRRHTVSIVFQNYNLIDYLTPIENVKLGGKAKPLELLGAVGLTEDQSKRNVMQLSGGQQQRVAIARALASDAEILLADEPTGNLDESTAEEIIDLFLDAAHIRGKCVIIVTHSKELAARADVVLTLRNGTIINDALVLEDQKI